MNKQGMPTHWLQVALHNVAEVRLGRQRSPDRATGPNMVPYLRAANVTWRGVDLTDVKEMDFTPAEVETYRLRDGDILLSEASGSAGEVGKPALYASSSGLYCFQNTLIRVRAGPELVRFIHLHFLKDALLGEFAKASRGVGIHHLGAEALSAWQVQVPPVGEQLRIVDALDSYLSRLDAAVATLEAAQKKLKAYRASVLKAAVEGRLVPTEAALARAEKRDFEPADVLLKRILVERRRRWEQAELAKLKAAGKWPKDDKWKAKYQDPKPPDTKGLPELPEGWCWASVDQLGEVVTGTTPSSTNTAYYGDNDSGNVAFFKPTDLDAGDNVRAARQYLTPAGQEHARRLPSGTVLVTCIGATIGKVGLSRVECTTNQQINAWVPDDALLSSRYSFWFFVSPIGRGQVIGNASSTTLPILNKGRFLQLFVPLPPAAEQERIVAEVERFLSVGDGGASVIAQQRRRTQRLRQSILKWAFEGKLVDQDPNDEPAEKLLERIRAERASAAPAPKRRGRKPKVATP